MGQVLLILNIIGAVIGILNPLIQAAEVFAQGKTPGPIKRQSVLDAFFKFVSTGVGSGWLRGDWEKLAASSEFAKPIIGVLIDSIVSVANTVGWAPPEEVAAADPLRTITP